MSFANFQSKMLLLHIHDLEKKLNEVTLAKNLKDQELEMAKSMNAQHQPVIIFYQIIKYIIENMANIYDL